MPLHRTGSASFSATPTPSQRGSTSPRPAPSVARTTSGSVRVSLSHTAHNQIEAPSHVGSRSSPLPPAASIRSRSASIRGSPLPGTNTMPSSPAASLYTMNPGDGHPPSVHHTVTPSPSLSRSRSATSRAPSVVSSQAGRTALGSTRGGGFTPRPSPMVYTSTLPPGSPIRPAAASIRSTVRSTSLHSPSIAPRASLTQSQTKIPTPPVNNIPTITRQLHPSELHLARRNANDLGQLLIAIMEYVKALKNQIRESKSRKKKKKDDEKENKNKKGEEKVQEDDLRSLVEDKARLERELSELAEGSVRAESVIGTHHNHSPASHHHPPEIKVNVLRVVPSARETMFVWEKEGYAGWKVRKISVSDHHNHQPFSGIL